ncbi:MAG: MFS transporter [Verrucomicrobiales bacterium]|nr:MFS transporter [Verrucomicrobiales bacterium]
MAILAAGVGFAIRGGIFDNWGSEFGFTGAQLGEIGGAGFTGFCFGIIIGGLLADKIGYGKLVIAAFAFHVLSAFVTFGASPDQEQATAYEFLKWGMFLFALANGVLEAVSNPLVATLFPKNRTHYLNILHASWPAGLVLGAAVGWFLDEGMGLSWKLQLSLYLIPTVIYGIMFFGQKFPKSEASAKGVKFGEMFKDVGLLGAVVVCYLIVLFCVKTLGLSDMIAYGIGFVLLVAVGVLTKFSIGSFLLFILFITHALVGAVELGTDQWMQNITGNILTPGQGKALFIWTSLVMFGLRFSAHFIESKLKLSPIGILFVCAVLATVGLNLTSVATGFAMAFLALTIYGIGKTFFWPTMLAVVGDRYPQSGAVAMSLMGGIGMMSAGLIGSEGLGYAKDRFAGEALKAENEALYEEYKAAEPSQFTVFAEVYGLDGAKLGEAREAEEPTADQQTVLTADIQGDRNTLKADSMIPAIMAVIYLLLLIFFKMRGGYKPVEISREQIAGGVEGPMEA